MLLQGDPAHYLVQFQGKFYACVSAQASNEVLHNPKLYLDEVVAVAKIQPELISLLELQSYFPTLHPFSSATVYHRDKLNAKSRAPDPGICVVCV